MAEEAFLTFKEAARRLNLPYHQVQRAAKKGLFPSYRPFGRRPLIRLSEVVAVIEASKVGGQKWPTRFSKPTRWRCAGFRSCGQLP
jgi:excisionase family DNA binding protein